jgi:hypothetical protein
MDGRGTVIISGAMLQAWRSQFNPYEVIAFFNVPIFFSASLRPLDQLNL